MKSPRQVSALLIDGECGLANFVIRCLSESKSACTHVLSSDPKPPLRYSRHIATFLHRCSHSDDELEGNIRLAIRNTRSELLLACSAPGTKFLIRRGSSIPNTRLMKLPSLRSFETANDKWSFHREAQACGAESPRTWLATDQSALEEAVFPVLLKPRIGDSGVGILRVDDSSALATWRESPTLDHGSYIIQEFIAGRDIGCSVFCDKGKVLAWTAQEAITRGQTTFGPAFDSRFYRHDGAFALAAQIAEHLSWTGVANFDMRIRNSDGKVLVLEMNPRFWASIHGSLRAGVDFVSLNCSLSQPVVRPMANTGHLNYYQGYRAFVHFLLGHATDIGCRLRDPLPDLVRKFAALKEKLTFGVGGAVSLNGTSNRG